ncbi:MAG: hypothetical protein IJ594_09510 [Oscillospiraceae bacterium]|nr:hypothetical protein [Oscillospiraceae bacterium]
MCAHGRKKTGTFAWGTDLPPIVTSETYLTTKLYGEFTPMTADDLVDFMRRHEELLIVADTMDDDVEVYKRLAECYPDVMDRFIVQIYHEREYDPIRALGFTSVIYTLYNADEQELEIANLMRFVNGHELVGLTFLPERLEGKRFRIGVEKLGVPLMVHTIDDYEEMETYLAKRNFTAVYTDCTTFPDGAA